ncbi:hypothetical protein [Paludibaculum fermentans]|uniref:Tetratricopeptide repeat protein n=1 Tax=Paludibaculum fermentans TaxID=1473598 RepID=A0A7S7NM08_PALFE|nr:hypothetical protein [Paludibaculum fermentans]QOY86040.1 hypothetical protein IRI77_24935 [Paludibaculum fermentans]
MNKVSRFAPFLLLLVFAAAAELHVQRAWAEWQWRRAHSSRAAEQSCHFVDGNPDCWRAAARLREQEGGDALPLWLRSLELDPRNAEAAIASALPLESAGKAPEAESLLLRGAELNHLWQPRWSLALFYARQGRRPEFWRWTSEAFDRSYWDHTAMFRQCSAQGGTAAFLLREILPARLDLRLALLSYQASQPADGQLRPVAEAVVECARPDEAGEALPVLVDAIGGLAGSGRPEDAFRVWMSMCRKNLVRYAAPTVDAPVTNPELRAPFLGSGFDWQAPAANGISSLVLTGGHGMRFTLTGSQPRETVLLQQWLFLRGGRTWCLTVDARTQGIDSADSALYWRILDAETSLPYEADRVPLHGDEWATTRLRYRGPPGDRLVRLALVAACRPGRIRMQGDVSLRRVELRAEPQP